MPNKPHSLITYLPLIVGFVIVLLLLGALFVFLNNTSNTAVYFILVGILAIGAALLTNNLTGKIEYVDERIKAYGPYAVFVIVLLAGLSFYKLNEQSFDFTIYLRDRQEQTVLQEGMLRLLLNNAPIDRRISAEGSIAFPGIPADLKDAKVRVELVGNTDWQFLNNSRATQVALTGKDATLTIEPNRRKCCLTGIVVDLSGQLVEDAEVWVDTLKPTRTSSTGRFVIQLPTDRRMESTFEVYARKDKGMQHLSVDRIQEPTLVLPIK